jgi:hypothetical protein
MKTELHHDQLQSQAHQWLWNEKPNLRYLFHSNFNDIKIIEKMLRTLTGRNIDNRQRMIILSQLKSVGLVKGVLDQELLYKGQMYFFDAKVGSDSLSKEQLEFKAINESNGAKCFEYYSLEEFKTIINNILS